MTDAPPTEIAGLVRPETIPYRTVLEGASGKFYIRAKDWRPHGYPEHLPPFTFVVVDPEGYSGSVRTLQVEDDGPLLVIRWGE